MSSNFETIDYELGAVAANHDDDDFADAQQAKKPRKEEIQWTEQREYVLASLFKSKKAYIKTKNFKMDDKKLMVLNEIKNHPSFAGEEHKLTVGGISAKYNRLEQMVLVKYSLSGEGSNLSGLPANPPRIEELVYKMLKEKMETEVRKDQKKKKDIDRAERVQNLQDKMLQEMVRPSLSAATEPAPPLASFLHGSEKNDSKSSSRNA